MSDRNPLPDDQVPIQTTGFALHDEFLVRDELPDEAIYVNRTAALIWMLSDGDSSISDLVELLSRAFPGPDGDVRADVCEAVRELSKHGAIELRDRKTPS